MTDLSRWRGHEIRYGNGIWVYADTGDAIEGNPRSCGHCGRSDTKEGHDGCIGTLDPDIVMNACCGHGDAEHAYIQFWDGDCIRGDAAQKYIEELMNE